MPKHISRRASYLQVRLAYHPLPQVIQAFCNRHWCGPPPDFTQGSPCSW